MKEDKFEEELKNKSSQDLMKILYNKMKEEDFETKNPKEEIKEVLKKENIFKNYLEGFDEEFETQTKLRIKETPVLISLYRDFTSQIYHCSRLYKFVNGARTNIEKELVKDFNENQKNLFEQYQRCNVEIIDDDVEQAFVYGYAMACQLREEAIKKYPYKQE